MSGSTSFASSVDPMPFRMLGSVCAAARTTPFRSRPAASDSRPSCCDNVVARASSSGVKSRNICSARRSTSSVFWRHDELNTRAAFCSIVGGFGAIRFCCKSHDSEVTGARSSCTCAALVGLPSHVSSAALSRINWARLDGAMRLAGALAGSMP